MAKQLQLDAALAERAMKVHRRLCPVYGCPVPYFQSLDPLSELVSTFLNHRTRNRDAKEAFWALRERFPTWEAVRDGEAGEIEECIRVVRWPDMKAVRLQEILRLITRERGTLDLSHLEAMPVEEARAWLERLPGVGRKTSAAVLSFSVLRKAALPVDSHHHRVAQRLGLIPPKMGVGPAHDVLEAYIPEGWDAQTVYDHHQVFMRHGHKVCHWTRPDCDGCVLLDFCPEGRARTEAAAA